MLKNLLAISLLASTIGCSAAYVGLPLGIDGYDAIRFQRDVEVKDHGINKYTFSNGSEFIADRAGKTGPIYCGRGFINGGPLAFCVGVDGDSLIIGPGSGFKEVRRPLPDGSFIRFKAKHGFM